MRIGDNYRVVPNGSNLVLLEKKSKLDANGQPTGQYAWRRLAYCNSLKHIYTSATKRELVAADELPSLEEAVQRIELLQQEFFKAIDGFDLFLAFKAEKEKELAEKS